MTTRAKSGVSGRGTPRVPPAAEGNVYYQHIQDPVGTTAPQEHILQFTGPGIAVSDDAPNDRTVVDLTGLVAAGSAVICFGADDAALAAAARYLYPWNGTSGPQNVDACRMFLPRLGTLRRMYVKHNLPLSADATLVTYTLMINGVATALAVTMAASAASGSNLVTNVNVLQGDEAALRITKAAALVNAITRPIVTVEYV